MLSQDENDFLSRVGPGTPAGQLLRRYWHVVGAAAELSDAKPKKKLRVLGEDLLLYKDRSGNYGLVAESARTAFTAASLQNGGRW